MNTEFSYALAFVTGAFGAFHCLGMCGGIAAGFFVRRGWEHGFLPHLYYHGTRILLYTLLGVTGAFMGRALVQTGALGKGQGILMTIAGLLIILVGLSLLGVLPWGRKRGNQILQLEVRPPRSVKPEIHRRHWTPVIAGLCNGFMPCGLVFSVAVKGASSADPVQAGLLMAAFGLGTLPAMAAVGVLAAVVGGHARGVAARLAGVTVIVLGLWTLYQGVVFYDIMRGLSNW